MASTASRVSSGDHLNQKLDPFSGHISRLKRQSGDIATGASQTAHKTASQWIHSHSEYNGDRRCGPLYSWNGASDSDNNIDLKLDELGCKIGVTIKFSLRPTINY